MKNLNTYSFLAATLHGLDDTCRKLPIDKEIKNFITLNSMLADELAALAAENESLKKENACLRADLEEATMKKGYCEDLAKELDGYQSPSYKPHFNLLAQEDSLETLSDEEYDRECRERGGVGL